MLPPPPPINNHHYSPSTFSSRFCANARTNPSSPKMPFCEVNKYQNQTTTNNNGLQIFYRTYGHGLTKVLLIIGLAGTHDSWAPQIKALTGTDTPNDADSSFSSSNHVDPPNSVDQIEACAFDNRGMGRSSVPTKTSEYTTAIMAKDAIALMDHLGWRKAHVFGHSMGAMIACKLAAMAPDRILSLALLNVTGGGFECFPKLDRKTISIAIRFLKARTPEDRAAVDLDTHYTKEYLDEVVGSHTRRTILYQQYVKAISSTGMQSNHGFEGQVNACWTHKMTTKEIEVIRSSGFLISVIHGRYDIIAQIYYARKLAEKLQPYARMVDLHGGHLVSHERPQEVNQTLLDLIKASEMKLNPYEWSNLSKKETGSRKLGFNILGEKNTDAGNCYSFLFDVLAKFHDGLLYIFALLVMAFDHGKRFLRLSRQSRVGISTS